MHKLTLAAVVVAAQALAVSAWAQDKTRADVKAEAASANKAGAIPKGEAAAPVPAAKSTKARADVKAEASAATKAGTTPSTKREEAANRQAKISMTKEEKAAARAKRKAEAAAANKAGTIPKGEASKQ
jgi:colicin import membrane protein